jgi:Peptidase family M23
MRIDWPAGSIAAPRSSWAWPALLAISLLGCPQPLFADGGPRELDVTIAPGRPFIERRGTEQRLNFDLIVDNDGPAPLRLVAVRVTLFDRADRVVLAKEIAENGHPPAIELLGPRALPPGGTLDLFNPFFSFEGDVPLHRLRYELSFMRGDRQPGVPLAFDADVVRKVDVFPAEYPGKTDLVLPLDGRLLVYDGHDFYSHHRRRDQADRTARRAGQTLPANLFAYDLMLVGADGLPFVGDPFHKEHWLSYGAEVIAPAAGLVVDVANDVAENHFDGDRVVQPPAGPSDPNGMGNHVVLDHENGEYSVILHMQPGSVRVHRGDRVVQGQPLGKVGFTGDSLVPHLHYFVSSAPAYPMQGLPSYFRGFRRLLGGRSVAVERGQIDSGDLVQSARRPPRPATRRRE